MDYVIVYYPEIQQKCTRWGFISVKDFKIFEQYLRTEAGATVKEALGATRVLVYLPDGTLGDAAVSTLQLGPKLAIRGGANGAL